MQCLSCKEELFSEFNFCPKCGARVKTQPEEVLINDKEMQDQELHSREDIDPKIEPVQFFPKIQTNHLIIVIISIGLAVILIGYQIYQSPKYAGPRALEKGLSALKENDFDKALSEFEIAENAFVENSSNLYSNTNYYLIGLNAYNNKDYEKAFDNLLLIDSTFPKYKDSENKFLESKKIIISKKLKEAKIDYDNKNYDFALNTIEKILSKYDANNLEAKKLKPIYKNALDKDNAKIAAETKREVEKLVKQMKAEAKAIAKQFAPKKIVDSDEKTIWKIYVDSGFLHFTGNYKGSGNFIVELLDDNQDLVKLIANEIGDYVSDKTVSVPYVGWYYLEVKGNDGSWKYNWQ